MYGTRTLRVTTSFVTFVLFFAAIIGVIISWWLNLGPDLLPSGLTRLGLIALSINGVFCMYPWLSRIGKRIDLLEPIYFISLLFLIVFFLRPIQILWDSGKRDPFLPNSPLLLQQTLFIGALAFVCFYIGYTSRIGTRLGQKLPTIADKWRYDRVVLISLIYIPIGILGYAYAITRSGGFGIFLNTLSGRALLASSGSWVFASLGILIDVTAIILGAYFFRTKRLKVLFAGTLILAISFSLLLGGRSGVIETLLTLFVILYYNQGWHKSNKRLTVGLLSSLFVGTISLFIVVQKNVRVLARSGENIGSVLSYSAETFQNSDFLNSLLGEFNQFDWLAIYLHVVPSRIPFQYGKTFLQFFTMFVPRGIWSGKPLTIDHVIRIALGGSNSGSPASIVGEFYVNFGMLGVVVGMIIFGILSRAIYSYLQIGHGKLASIIFYAYTFAGLHRFFTRDFASKMFPFVLFMIPLVLALLFITQQKKNGIYAN